MKEFLMLDLETLNTSVSDPAIIQIGVCYAQWQERVGWSFADACAPCTFDPHEIDLATLLWWTTQPRFHEVLEGALGATSTAPEVFERLLRQVGKKVPTTNSKALAIVANPPTFDIAMLRTAYAKEGFAFPFHFSRELCYRTAKNLFGDGRKAIEAQWSKEGKTLARHDAGYDALLQAVDFARILDGAFS